jgi:hypothetical protein
MEALFQMTFEGDLTFQEALFEGFFVGSNFLSLPRIFTSNIDLRKADR